MDTHDTPEAARARASSSGQTAHASEPASIDGDGARGGGTRRGREGVRPGPARGRGVGEAADAEGGGTAVERADLRFEFMLNALRLKEGCEIASFRERTGLPMSAIEAALDEAERRGLILRDLQRIEPTAQVFDFLNDLQQLFLPATR